MTDADNLREHKIHLRALNTQLNTFSGLYQLTGEYAALCEQLLKELQAKEALPLPKQEQRQPNSQ